MAVRLTFAGVIGSSSQRVVFARQVVDHWRLLFTTRCTPHHTLRYALWFIYNIHCSTPSRLCPACFSSVWLTDCMLHAFDCRRLEINRVSSAAVTKCATSISWLLITNLRSPSSLFLLKTQQRQSKWISKKISCIMTSVTGRVFSVSEPNFVRIFIHWFIHFILLSE